MTREHDPCAMCAYFRLPVDGSPTGRCVVWARPTPWNGQIGVLFEEAKDRAPRARYVVQQQEQQQELEKA